MSDVQQDEPREPAATIQAPWEPSFELPSSKKLTDTTRVSGRSNGDRQCTYVKRNGERCKLAPITGGTVCASHGGNGPQVRAAAEARLLAMVEPAFATLFKALGTNCKHHIKDGVAYCEDHGLDCPDWPVRVSAAKAILDRGGYGPKSTLELQRPPQEDDSHLTVADLVRELQALTELAKLRASSEPINQPEPQALPPAEFIDAELADESPNTNAA